MKPQWAGWLRLAVRMGLDPRAFWALSVAEWRALAGGAGDAPPGRDDLARLMATHPDGKEKT